ncbi:MAG: hypothetical protein WBF30_08235 [Candidatus Acidiferrales bacterium]
MDFALAVVFGEDPPVKTKSRVSAAMALLRELRGCFAADDRYIPDSIEKVKEKKAELTANKATGVFSCDLEEGATRVGRLAVAPVEQQQGTPNGAAKDHSLSYSLSLARSARYRSTCSEGSKSSASINP